MNHAQSIASRYYATREGGLLVSGRRIEEVVEEHETPLFVYDAAVLGRKWQLLRDAFPPEFDIYYSVKANPNRAILEFFLERSRGSGLEVASGGELCQALQAGCAPERIIFAGPGKSERELTLALLQNIGEIHVESLVEAERIAAISKRHGVEARVAVRVNPHADVQGGAMRMGGKPAPFGIDEEKIESAVDKLSSEVSIRFQGIHLFVGTQILDHRTVVSQYRKGLDIARQVATRLCKPLATVDLGGGLGIPYFAHETELDMVALSQELRALMDTAREDPLFAGTRFIIEPGRYLVGDGGIYVTRINDIKVSRGKKFLITDGGMNHHLAASGNLGQVIKRNFPIALLNKMDDVEELETVDVAGPLCTPLDVLGRDVLLPKAELGDLVGVFQSGAYARSASPMAFLSRPSPAEVLVLDGEARLIRRPGTFDDWTVDIP